jgi:Fe-S cluster biosynthesis and repair protein YggX
MSDITCSRCGQTRERMAFKPFPNDLGQKVYDTICAVCWGDWVKHQQALINHYGLQLQDPKARKFLYESLEQFLFTSAPQA